jgi:hypothetical protein
MRKETLPFLIKENEEGIGICVNILELTLMLQKLYNPADRDAEKAFHLPARSRFGKGRAATFLR